MTRKGPSLRVAKYQHRLCNTEFSDLHLSKAQLSLLCLLFLRGVQTTGELKSRASRMHNFDSLESVEKVLGIYE